MNCFLKDTICDEHCPLWYKAPDAQSVLESGCSFQVIAYYLNWIANMISAQGGNK